MIHKMKEFSDIIMVHLSGLDEQIQGLATRVSKVEEENMHSSYDATDRDETHSFDDDVDDCVDSYTDIANDNANENDNNNT